MGWKQHELAQKIGILESATISKYEKGINKPDHAKICKIADRSFVTTDWLISGKINRNRCNWIKNEIIKREFNAELFARKVGIPENIIVNIIEYKIGPSESCVDIIKTTLGKDSKRETGDIKLLNRISFLEGRIDELQKRIIFYEKIIKKNFE